MKNFVKESLFLEKPKILTNKPFETLSPLSLSLPTLSTETLKTLSHHGAPSLRRRPSPTDPPIALLRSSLTSLSRTISSILKRGTQGSRSGTAFHPTVTIFCLFSSSHYLGFHPPDQLKEADLSSQPLGGSIFFLSHNDQWFSSPHHRPTGEKLRSVRKHPLQKTGIPNNLSRPGPIIFQLQISNQTAGECSLSFL